jgi:hypothetical protein
MDSIIKEGEQFLGNQEDNQGNQQSGGQDSYQDNRQDEQSQQGQQGQQDQQGGGGGGMMKSFEQNTGDAYINQGMLTPTAGRCEPALIS